MTSPLNSVLPSLKSIIFSFQLKWYIVFCTIFTMCSSSAMPILSGRWRCRNNEICLYRYVQTPAHIMDLTHARTTPGNATTTAKTNFFKLKLLRRKMLCIACPIHGMDVVRFEEIKTKAFWLKTFLLGKCVVPFLATWPECLCCTRDVQISGLSL